MWIIKKKIKDNMKLALTLLGAVAAQEGESAYLCFDLDIGASCDDRLDALTDEWENGDFADNPETAPAEGMLCGDVKAGRVNPDNNESKSLILRCAWLQPCALVWTSTSQMEVDSTPSQVLVVPQSSSLVSLPLLLLPPLSEEQI